MLAVLMFMALLAVIAITVLSFSAADRRRAVRFTRAEVRETCAQSGLNYARIYFASRFADWPTFFSQPQFYNPVTLPTDSVPAFSGPQVPSNPYSPTLRASHPELFLDLDGDTRADVYVFIRDNRDEFLPASPNFQLDNDNNAIVGAVCISQTMQPRREDNTIDADSVVYESLVSVIRPDCGPGSQALGGSTGTGNQNGC